MSEQTSKSEIQARRQATIVDVAHAAGVAIGTVSRHLNGMPVRAANRDQIERAIAKLGYRRNANAVAMKTDTTHIVGFMVPALSEFHAGMLDQLSRRMRRAGRAVLSFCHDVEYPSMREGLEFFASRRVDAVVMDGEELLRQDLLRYIDEGLVVVLYDNDIPGLPVDRVFVDNRGASRRIIDHVLDLDHKRVAIIHGNPRDATARERTAGFVEAHEAHGLTPDPALFHDGQWKESGGYEGMQHLMSLPEPPTAVFSVNYNMTIGALAYIQEKGLMLPRDLSLVSFDDVPAFRLHNPGITCVGQPVDKIAETITEIVNTRLANPAAMGRRLVKLDCDIILRGSARRLK